MLSLLLLSTALFYDVGVNISPYISLLPAECSVRIDIVSRNNVYFDGYAWYSGRIIIYDGNNLDYDRKRFVLAHELGHVCAVNNRDGTYLDREINADDYAYNILSKGVLL
jgi:Zn-dependent peptidase ImmA (M78 family)